jgi:hypothetical protein
LRTNNWCGRGTRTPLCCCGQLPELVRRASLHLRGSSSSKRLPAPGGRRAARSRAAEVPSVVCAGADFTGIAHFSCGITRIAPMPTLQCRFTPVAIETPGSGWIGAEVGTSSRSLVCLSGRSSRHPHHHVPMLHGTRHHGEDSSPYAVSSVAVVIDESRDPFGDPNDETPITV